MGFEMSVANAEQQEFSSFSVSEWNRLDHLTNLHDTELKSANTRIVIMGPKARREIAKEKILDCVVETAYSTAQVYGMKFDPHSPVYSKLVDDLTDNFMKVVSNEPAREKVRAILPSDLSLSERHNRLDVFGLSGHDAVRLERMRQKGISGQRITDARLHMQLQRGNLLALTEVNRIINATVETVWLDNMVVSKARKRQKSGMLLEADGRVTAITSLRGIPAHAKKQIVTRRDYRTCDYCWPLEGETTPLGAIFKTRYGTFQHPPFHPRCRCFMIVSY